MPRGRELRAGHGRFRAPALRPARARRHGREDARVRRISLRRIEVRLRARFERGRLRFGARRVSQAGHSERLQRAGAVGVRQRRGRHGVARGAAGQPGEGRLGRGGAEHEPRARPGRGLRIVNRDR